MGFKKILIIVSLLSLNIFADAKAAKKAPAKKQVSSNFYKELKDKEDYDKFLKDGKELHVVKYYATWCGACKSSKEAYNKVSDKYKDKAKFAAIDIDNKSFKDFISEKKIASVPTIIFFKDGKEVARERGAMGETELDNKVKKLI